LNTREDMCYKPNGYNTTRQPAQGRDVMYKLINQCCIYVQEKIATQNTYMLFYS